MGAILYSNVSQHLLNQAGNISYLVRNTTRMNTVPDDRQADYSFRDIYVTFLGFTYQEIIMRAMDALYSAPQFVRYLGFHNLGNEYAGIPGAKNYKLLPRPLESKMMGALVSTSSFYNVGNLLRTYSIRNLKDGPDKEAKKQELEVLAEQFERRFDPKGYFEYYYKLAPNKADALNKVIGSVEKDQLHHFATTAQGTTPELTPEARKILSQAIEKHKSLLNKEFGSGWSTQTVDHATRGKEWSRQLGQLVQDGVTSRYVQQMVISTRKSGGWAKLLTTVVINTIFNGIFASWLNVNVIQPWQDKLVATRGTSKEVVSPQIWSIIPGVGAGVLTHLLIRNSKAGYGLRFGLAAIAGMVAYTTSTILMLKQRLSQPPKGKYAHYAAEGFHLQAQRKVRDAEKRRLGIPVPSDTVHPPEQKLKHNPLDSLQNPFSFFKKDSKPQ